MTVAYLLTVAGRKVLVRAAKVQPQKQKEHPETKPKALPVAQSVTEPYPCTVTMRCSAP